MDFALVGMAWIVVSKLHMRNRREKFGVGLAMSMGLIAGATSIVKAVIFPTLSSGDITFTSASLHIWSMVEPSVTIIATSIPLLRVIFTQVRRMTTQNNSTQVGNGNTAYARSISGSEGRHKGSGSVSFTTVNISGGSKGMPYVDSSNDSNEALMLENLPPVVPLEIETEHHQQPEAEDVAEGSKPTGISFYVV